MFNSIINKFLKRPLITKIAAIYLTISNILEKFALPLLLLLTRFWMARVFWYSGLVKISNWQSTIFLFKEEYQVPIISPELAAYFSTIFELTCPVLLILGFATRLSTLPMLTMTAVIQFTYLDLLEHSYWAILLALILFYGPGQLSLDYFILRQFKK